MCQKWLHSYDGAGGFKELCGGVPNMVKKSIDIFCKKEGPENSVHNLWAARILEGHDNGKMLVFCTRCGWTAVSMIRGSGQAVPWPGQNGAWED